MNIRTYTEQDTIFATSRLRLPREVNSSMEKWNKLAHTFHARVTFIPGMERPIGPLGNYTQTLTVTIEGDCDDPQCQKLFDALYSGDPQKIELIKKELRYGRATDDASNTTNAVDQSTARNTQKNAAPLNRAIAVNSSDTTPLIKRIFMFLEDEEWDRVNEYCETVLDLDPENARAYLGMLMAELKVRYVKDLKDQAESFAENKNYQKAVRYADEKLKAGLIGCINHINTRNENERLEGLYISALEELNTVSNSAKNISEQSIQKIAELFESISHYKDAADKAGECYKKIEEIRLERKRQEEIARIEDERRAREEKIAEQKTKKACAIAALIVSMFVAVVLLITNVIVPNNQYKEAVALMEAGQYEEAIAAFEALDGHKDSEVKVTEIYREYILKPANVGDCLAFGKYEQDNDTANGAEKIEWLVLDKQDDKLLVISKKALDCKPYGITTFDGITWCTSTLRKWLNKDFVNTAFSTKENAMIPWVKVSADKNPEYDTDPGVSTQDKVFLLSITEAKKYFSSDSERECTPTDYAVAQGVFTAYSGASCDWWLRTPGEEGRLVATCNGDFYEHGSLVWSDDVAVRPAMWIDINSVN